MFYIYESKGDLCKLKRTSELERYKHRESGQDGGVEG